MISLITKASARNGIIIKFFIIAVLFCYSTNANSQLANFFYMKVGLEKALEEANLYLQNPLLVGILAEDNILEMGILLTQII